MNVLIIEDEPAAARRLNKLIGELFPDVEIVASTDSIESTLQWVANNAQPDLVLSDIHLTDGLSFEIFEEGDLDCPVIFITAYDQYAINAFKVNGIDYLLKPVKKSELEQSILKFRKLTGSRSSPSIDFSKIIHALKTEKPEYQKRIVVKYGQHIKAVEVEDIRYFFTEDKVVHLCMADGKKLGIDFNLDELEKVLDPGKFFRINRQFIINYDAIDAMFAYSKARVKIKLNPPSDKETVVSTERSPKFKVWLKGKA